MATVSISDARRRLSQLIDQAAAGHDVIIARRGKPVAILTRLRAPKPRIRFGLMKGRVRIADDFDASLPGDMLSPW